MDYSSYSYGPTYQQKPGISNTGWDAYSYPSANANMATMTNTGGTTYQTSGPGGSWSNTVATPSNVGQIDPMTGHRIEAPSGPSGTWTGGGGQTTSALPEYQAMRQRQQQGADFGQYQNQLNKLLQDPSSIQNDPAYQFRMQQGQEAINRSAAAKGTLNSGGVLAELEKYGQGMASQERQNQINTLADLMRGQQQFGVASGYYDPTNYGNVYGSKERLMRQQPAQWSGSSTMGPSAPVDYNKPYGMM